MHRRKLRFAGGQSTSLGRGGDPTEDEIYEKRALCRLTEFGVDQPIERLLGLTGGQPPSGPVRIGDNGVEGVLYAQLTIGEPSTRRLKASK